jgi:hypothetical protein
MAGEIDLERAQREESRWRVLRALDAGRPYPVSEQIVLRVIEDIKLPITASGLRRELDYLEERELIRIHDKESPVWSAELTRIGIDVVEYTVPCDAGIARPKKWG